jgi:4-amino-4-deoxy-L-arabinose transferase-like glycosyltransferase
MMVAAHHPARPTRAVAAGAGACTEVRFTTIDRARRGIAVLPGLAWLIAIAVAGVLLAAAGAYGFHRDELYFILAGRHPDWGYVDQPPLTPLLTAAAVSVAGLSPTAVRIAPALVAGAVILLAADIARRLGGSRYAQVLAALVLAISGWLGAGHLDVTVTYDILFWTIALWLLVALLALADRGATDPLRWLALGLVMGVALENKTLAISLAGTVALSLLLLRRWEVLRQPWPWLAAALAIAIWLPNLAWQAGHGYPQVTMAQSISTSQGAGIEGRAKALVELLAIAGPLLFPVSVAGAVWLLRSPGSRPWRPLGLAFVLQLAVMLLANGKSYYSAGFVPLLIAAGSIPLDGWLHRGRQAARRVLLALAAVVSGAAVALLMLPIVPVASLAVTPIPGLYSESVAQVGWPQLAAQVETVAASLPASEGSTAVIVTATYGEYAALSLLGAGLPPVYSGHNSTWDWGRPADGAGPVVLVAWSLGHAASDFAGCRVAATIESPNGLPTQEQGSTILVCSGPAQPWHVLWPSLRHIS